MAIVIKDMKMPETCGKCPFCVRYDTYYDICCITDDLIWYGEREQKKATCPLVEIPDTLVGWKPLTEDAELKDHYWYLIAHKGYGTPLKAKYHISERLDFFATDSKGNAIMKTSYVWEWEKDGITHYMEMPLLPWQKEEVKE